MYTTVYKTVYTVVYKTVYKTVQRALFALFKSERRWSGSVVGCIVILQVYCLTPTFCRRETANSAMTRYPPQIASNTSRPTAVEYAENIRGLSGQGDAYEILNAFSPLTKKELMKFAEDPHWVKQRKVFLVGAWLFWSAITGFSGLILVFSKRCEASPDTTWLQEANIYHIFPRSFVDSDRDGIGDIKGKLVSFICYTATVTGCHLAAILLTCTHQFSHQHF